MTWWLLRWCWELTTDSCIAGLSAPFQSTKICLGEVVALTNMLLYKISKSDSNLDYSGRQMANRILLKNGLVRTKSSIFKRINLYACLSLTPPISSPIHASTRLPALLPTYLPACISRSYATFSKNESIVLKKTRLKLWRSNNVEDPQDPTPVFTPVWEHLLLAA